MKTTVSSKGIARLLATIALASSAVYNIQAAPLITLNDGNSVAQIDAGSSAGMFNWLVDGNDYLAQQWFWYRVGPAGPEAPINTISAPVVVTTSTNIVSTTYANGLFSVSVLYQLTGSSPNSGIADISESITINNLTANPLDFHFFQYSDFDLPGPNNVVLSTNFLGRFTGANQNGLGLSESIAGTSPAALHGEAALFPFTLNRLNDGLPTLLNDVKTAGPGDVTWALEWDFTIQGNDSQLISKIKHLEVPEPTGMSIAVIGLAIAGTMNAYRRRRS